MTHISGFERSQILLLPEGVDDYVGACNPVRQQAVASQAEERRKDIDTFGRAAVSIDDEKADDESFHGALSIKNACRSFSRSL